MKETPATLVICAPAKSKKVKEADLYSAFIEVPYTQGAIDLFTN